MPKSDRQETRTMTEGGRSWDCWGHQSLLEWEGDKKEGARVAKMHLFPEFGEDKRVSFVLLALRWDA